MRKSSSDDPYGCDADAISRLVEPSVEALHETLGGQLGARINELLEDRELNARLRACYAVLPPSEFVRRMQAIVVDQIVCMFLASLTTTWIMSTDAADARDMFNDFLDDMLEQERRSPQRPQ